MRTKDFKALDDNFAGAFKSARVHADLSQEAVAERMREYGFEMSQPVIGKIERAQRRVTIGEAEALSACVNISLSSLLAGPESLGLERARTELYRLRNDFKKAAMDFQEGQAALAILADGIDGAGKLEEHEREDLERLIMEQLENVLRELKHDNQAENQGRKLRDDMDWDDDEERGEELAKDSSTFYGRYYQAFGDDVSHDASGDGFFAVMAPSAESDEPRGAND